MEKKYLLTAEAGAINAPLAGDGAGVLSFLRQKLSLLVTRTAATPLLGRVRAREHHIDADQASPTSSKPSHGSQRRART